MMHNILERLPTPHCWQRSYSLERRKYRGEIRSDVSRSLGRTLALRGVGLATSTYEVAAAANIQPMLSKKIGEHTQ